MNIYELARIDEFEKLDFWQLKKIEELTETYDGNEGELFELQQENEELEDENCELKDEKDRLQISFCFLNSKIEEIQEEIKRCMKKIKEKETQETLSYINKKLQGIKEWNF